MAALDNDVAIDDIDGLSESSRTSASFAGSFFGNSRDPSTSSETEGDVGEVEEEEEAKGGKQRKRRAHIDPKLKRMQTRERVNRWRERQRTSLQAAELANSELAQMNDELRTRLRESETRRSGLAALIRKLTAENEQLRAWKEARAGSATH